MKYIALYEDFTKPTLASEFKALLDKYRVGYENYSSDRQNKNGTGAISIRISDLYSLVNYPEIVALSEMTDKNRLACKIFDELERATGVSSSAKKYLIIYSNTKKIRYATIRAGILTPDSSTAIDLTKFPEDEDLAKRALAILLRKTVASGSVVWALIKALKGREVSKDLVNLLLSSKIKDGVQQTLKYVTGVPDSEIIKYAKSKVLDLSVAVASREYPIPLAAIQALIASNNRSNLSSLLQRSDVTSSTIKDIWLSSNHDLSGIIAGKSNTPPDILVELVKSNTNIGIRLIAYHNSNYPKGGYIPTDDLEMDSLMKGSNKVPSPGLFNKFINDTGPRVVSFIAKHPSTSDDLLIQLMHNKKLYEISDRANLSIRVIKKMAELDTQGYYLDKAFEKTTLSNRDLIDLLDSNIDRLRKKAEVELKKRDVTDDLFDMAEPLDE